MERIRFMSHQGSRIFLIDLTGCSPDRVAEITDQVPPLVTQEPPHSVLLLADFTNAELTREAMERVKIASVLVKKHLKRSAWVISSNASKGLHGSVQVFSTRNIASFATREQALEYLTAGELKSETRTA